MLRTLSFKGNAPEGSFYRELKRRQACDEKLQLEIAFFAASVPGQHCRLFGADSARVHATSSTTYSNEQLAANVDGMDDLDTR